MCYGRTVREELRGISSPALDPFGLGDLGVPHLVGSLWLGTAELYEAALAPRDRSAQLDRVQAQVGPGELGLGGLRDVRAQPHTVRPIRRC